MFVTLLDSEIVPRTNIEEDPQGVCCFTVYNGGEGKYPQDVTFVELIKKTVKFTSC